jgi:hypothetical protein
MGDFPLELDHLFIWVSRGAPEAAALQSSGLHTDGAVHRHAGQGTSSVVFTFEGAYLELIWVDEPDAVERSGQKMGTDLLARADWRRTGASPFGVGLRRRAPGGAPPFPVREYWAEWMKPETSILIAESSAEVKEPLYFVVPDDIALPPPEQLEQLFLSQPEQRNNFVHPLGVRKLTGVELTLNREGEFSSTASTLSLNGVVGVSRGAAPHAELIFDQGARGESLPLAPSLPLTLKY